MIRSFKRLIFAVTMGVLAALPASETCQAGARTSVSGRFGPAGGSTSAEAAVRGAHGYSHTHSDDSRADSMAYGVDHTGTHYSSSRLYRTGPQSAIGTTFQMDVGPDGKSTISYNQMLLKGPTMEMQIGGQSGAGSTSSYATGRYGPGGSATSDSYSSSSPTSTPRTPVRHLVYSSPVGVHLVSEEEMEEDLEPPGTRVVVVPAPPYHPAIYRSSIGCPCGR